MDEKDILIVEKRPELRSPYFVCGFNGWLNGGSVSLGGITYLTTHLKAVKFAEMRTSHFHMYQVPGSEALRPIFKMDEGLITETNFPIDHFYYALNHGSDHDLVILLGSEPNLYVTSARELPFWADMTKPAATTRKPSKSVLR